ncbi:MAG TPA: hypothetical protein VKI19_16970, partial [Acidimicrobiales bacterium]|nr:hypothetical protein [Acidimicrobiales bacterium]
MPVFLNRRARRAAALLGATSLLAVSCGARVPYYGATTQGQVQPGFSSNPNAASSGNQTSTTLGRSAGKGQSNTVTRVVGGSGPSGSVSGSSSNSTVPGSGGGSGPVAGGVTVANMTPDTFPFDPQQQAALCQGTAGNTASAPGVTPTSITVGN